MQQVCVSVCVWWIEKKSAIKLSVNGHCAHFLCDHYLLADAIKLVANGGYVQLQSLNQSISGHCCNANQARQIGKILNLKMFVHFTFSQSRPLPSRQINRYGYCSVGDIERKTIHTETVSNCQTLHSMKRDRGTIINKSASSNHSRDSRYKVAQWKLESNCSSFTFAYCNTEYCLSMSSVYCSPNGHQQKKNWKADNFIDAEAVSAIVDCLLLLLLLDLLRKY